jgi:HEPN domain-containing protein
MRQRKDRKRLRDGICYHSQQCAEKYLKARLVEAGGKFPKTHDLTTLLQLVLPHEPLWSALLPLAQSLTSCAVDFRYPGQNATESETKLAMQHCKTIRTEVRHSLGLK